MLRVAVEDARGWSGIGEAGCEGKGKVVRTGEVDDAIRRQQPDIMDCVLCKNRGSRVPRTCELPPVLLTGI